MRGGNVVERRPTAAAAATVREVDVELAEKRPLQGSSNANHSHDYYYAADDDDDTPFCCVPLKTMIVMGVLFLIVSKYSKNILDEAVG